MGKLAAKIQEEIERCSQQPFFFFVILPIVALIRVLILRAPASRPYIGGGGGSGPDPRQGGAAGGHAAIRQSLPAKPLIYNVVWENRPLHAGCPPHPLLRSISSIAGGRPAASSPAVGKLLAELCGRVLRRPDPVDRHDLSPTARSASWPVCSEGTSSSRYFSASDCCARAVPEQTVPIRLIRAYA